MVRRLLPSLPLTGVLLLALALRVWGLAWGLPSETHYFSYHPDESMVLAHAMSMNLLRGDVLPHWYNYGSLQLFLVDAANTGAFLFGSSRLVITDYATQHAAWAHQYLVGRGLTVMMAVGTVAATAALGTRLWGRRAGLLAAALLAVTPLDAQHAHWLTVDVPATFWGTLSLLWAARLATGDRKRPRAAALAGLFAGLAAATKYNLALTLLPLALAPFLPFPNREGTGRLRPGLGLFFLGLGAAVLAFLLACPGAVLDTAEFLKDVGYEAYHVQHLAGAEFAGTGSGFVYQIARNLDAGLGLPLLLLCLTSIGYALGRRERGDGLLAAFALPYYVLISLAVVRYARYTIPLLPVLALWAGRLLADLSRLPHPAARRGVVGAGAALLLFTLGDTLLLIRPMAGPDNRDRALRRIGQLAPAPGAVVGFAVQPWFYTPPVSPWFCLSKPGEWRRETPQAIQDRIVYTSDWDARALQIVRPALVVLSEYDYDDALRRHDPAAVAYLQGLRRDYTRRDVIAGPAAPGEAVGTVGGMPTHGLPSDMLYAEPIISIYMRK